MSDLISRRTERALSIVDRLTDNKAISIRERGTLRRAILLPERPTGEWIRTGSLGNGNAQYMCSNCHYGDEHAESQEVPYCWHCGAMMGKLQTQKFADNDTASGGLASAT